MAMLSSLLLFLIFSMGNADGSESTHVLGRCPRGWSKFGPRCYKYFSQSVPWITAERTCQSLGANLASVHDQPANNFLLSLLPSTRTWDGEWLWSDGTVYDYTNWCSGEPNNFGGPENCLEINWTSNHCWNDASCSTSISYICELRFRHPDPY